MSGKVLEREREVAALAALSACAAGGVARTIVLEGPPGVGKSTLLSTLGPDSGHLRVLAFRCGELERELAWAGVGGLLSPALGELPAARRRRLLAGPASPAAALFGAAPTAAAGESATPDSFEVLAALLRLCAELARAAPLVIVVDDAHWCDRPTLAFLAYLQRRLAELPATLVLATRPAAMTDEPQRTILEQIRAAPDAELLRLTALGRDSVTRLVHAQGFPDADVPFCDACHRVTGGNPFFVHELLHELRERGDAGTPDAGALAEVTPPAVLRSLTARLGRLTVPGAAELAGSAAVLGEGATLAQAARLADLDDGLAVDALDALVAAELLAPGEPLRFVHPLVRGAIYSDIPPARRARQHARAARLLAAHHAPPERVALHLLDAPRIAAAATVTALRAGAERARAQGAPRAAVRYLRRALEEPPEPELRAALLTELAHAETAFGDGEAVVHLKQALALTTDARATAELLHDLGRAHHDAGRFAEAAAAFERGLERQGAAPDRELAERLEAGYLVSATLDSERVADANARIRAIESGPAEIRSPSQRTLLAQVLFMRTMSGAPHDSIVELALRIWGDGRLLREEGAGSYSVWHVIGALNWADAYGPALRAIEQTLADADARGLALARAQGLYARSWPRLWMGDLRGAEADGWGAIEIWEGGLETYLPAAAYWCGRASLELGDPERARAALAVCGTLDRWQGTGMAGFMHALQGHLHAHEGRLAEAVASHRACGTVMESLMIVNPSPMPWRSEVARGLRMLGELDEARQLASEELAMAQRAGAPRAIGVARATLGLCTPGEPGLAELATAAELLAACGARTDQLRALAELGAGLRRAGHPRDARGPLGAALELAHETGAVVIARRAETELRAAGGRGRRTAESGPDSLTASERRIAELAAAGHTNRDIAGQLQVSVKAVEWHLHQSYRKLAIRGRAQLPGALG